MAKKNEINVPLDISAFLHMGTRLDNYTNMFRQDICLKEEVEPAILQQALNNIANRFPTIVAGIHTGFFAHSIIPAASVPEVMLDRSFLNVMTDEEIEECSMRVKYRDNMIIGEFFHSLTDGYGGFVFLHSLAAEYLHLRHGVEFTASDTLFRPSDPVRSEEIADDYLRYATNKAWFASRDKAYQMVRDYAGDESIHYYSEELDTEGLLAASRRYGVSMTSVLSSVLIRTLFEVQEKDKEENKNDPVIIMVPIDLRRIFPSISVRNFLLYAMPAINRNDDLTFNEIVAEVATQLKELSTPEQLSVVMSMNANLQRYWISKAIPLWIKEKIMRFGYGLFGEASSTLTLSNLGSSMLPKEMEPYVEKEHVFLTPRIFAGSNFCINSYGGKTFINTTWRGKDTSFEASFYRNLAAVMEGRTL